MQLLVSKKRYTNINYLLIMKTLEKLTLVLLVGLSIGVNTSYGQDRPDFSQPISSDSLSKLYTYVDEMNMFNLLKIQESYIYRSRVAPTDQNKEILKYIEERIAIIKKD